MRYLLVAVAVLALALVSPAQAQSVSLGGHESWNHDVPLVPETTQFEIHAPVTLSEDGQAYLKTVATPWNPAYLNGTAGESGWWTDVYLVESAQERFVDSTTGKTPVQLGDFAAGQMFHVKLVLHAPAEALTTQREYSIAYALAATSASDGSGNGGHLDASAPLVATLRISDGSTASTEQTPSTPPPVTSTEPARQETETQPFRLTPQAMLLGLLGLTNMAFLAIVAFLIVDRRRSRRE